MKVLRKASLGSNFTGSYKKKYTGKTPFFVIGPFCTPHSICLKGATKL